MAKEITITANAQLTFIETGTDEQYNDLMKRIELFGGIEGFKAKMAEAIIADLKEDGPLPADDVQISNLKIFFTNDNAEEVDPFA